MTDLTLSEFENIPRGEIKEALKEEAEKMHGPELNNIIESRKKGRSSFCLFDNLRAVSSRLLLALNRS